MFQKRMAPLNKEMKPQGRGNVPALRAEATRPEQDHSRIESARSNSWAECRDTQCRHRADGETCLLTFSFIGLLRPIAQQISLHSCRERTGLRCYCFTASPNWRQVTNLMFCS